MSKSDWQRCVDIFYEIDYIPSLEWTLYFEPVAEDEETGETRDFDPYKPFRLRETGKTVYYDFIDVEVINGDVEGYSD